VQMTTDNSGELGWTGAVGPVTQFYIRPAEALATTTSRPLWL